MTVVKALRLSNRNRQTEACEESTGPREGD